VIHFNNIFVVIPTYNERENISVLIEQLMALDLDLHVLVVDDSSPDGTADIVDQLAPQYPDKVFVFRRTKKEGLGKAYKAGMAWVLQKGADAVVQMDADLSHDPQRVPALIEGLEGADVVLGSRYIPGGKLLNWPWHRRLLSYFGNLYARIILRSPVHDLTGGFKAFKASVLASIHLESIVSEGYVFQIEMTTRALKKKVFTSKKFPLHLRNAKRENQKYPKN